ncbi:MAG: 3-dehydroquinate synthase [Bryobacteraceae bacterium]
MPSFEVKTPQRTYSAIVERGVLERLAAHLPARHGKVFVVSTEDVLRHQGQRLTASLRNIEHSVLHLPGGEEQKRLAPVEALAEEMVVRGADRSSLVIAFGGGIVSDMAGFLAAMFMRGIPVLQVPTTLLAQVDASIGGKTGVNLVAGKNLIGAFHQPLAVLIDPSVLDSLPEREYRAGLYEVIKYGIIRSPRLFDLLTHQRDRVFRRDPEVVDDLITESVKIKAEVVSADEREGGLRRILNYGHTFGHALEAETAYSHLLHGEAVAFGMNAAAFLGRQLGLISEDVTRTLVDTVTAYGPIPSLQGISADNLLGRLAHDKKTIQGNVHFVLPVGVGDVIVRSGVAEAEARTAIERALAC